MKKLLIFILMGLMLSITGTSFAINEYMILDTKDLQEIESLDAWWCINEKENRGLGDFTTTKPVSVKIDDKIHYIYNIALINNEIYLKDDIFENLFFENFSISNTFAEKTKEFKGISNLTKLKNYGFEIEKINSSKLKIHYPQNKTTMKFFADILTKEDFLKLENNFKKITNKNIIDIDQPLTKEDFSILLIEYLINEPSCKTIFFNGNENVTIKEALNFLKNNLSKEDTFYSDDSDVNSYAKPYIVLTSYLDLLKPSIPDLFFDSKNFNPSYKIKKYEANIIFNSALEKYILDLY